MRARGRVGTRWMLSVGFLLGMGPAPCDAAPAPFGGTVEQWFPADEPEGKEETRWKVTWGYTGRCEGSADLPAGALFIDGAWFRRAKDEPWVQVVSDLRLADIYVAYHAWGGARRYYDISMYDGSFGPVLAKESDLGPNCVAQGRVVDAYTLLEVHDDAPRWREGPRGWDCGKHGKDRGRRGQRMILWTTFYAENYRYVIEYTFRDDGSITCRLGATAHNITKPSADGGDGHLHTACWRLVPALDDEKAVAVTLASTVQNPVDAGATTVLTPVPRETGIVWKAEEFTVVRLRSTKIASPRGAGDYIGYDLLMERSGAARTNGVGEEFTRADVWITREQGVRDAAPNLSYKDVPTHVDGELLAGGTIAVWHTSPVVHSSRNEDFDADDQPDGGVALTMWSSFTLKPRNLFASTPLYK